MKKLASCWLGLLCTLLVGCGAQSQMLGTPQATVLIAADRVGPPGEPIDLTATLRAGDFLIAQTGRVIRFSRDGRLFKAAEIDESGYARVRFTPPGPGEYRFTVSAAADGLPDNPPPPREILVACLPADAPIAIVDLDKTVVASGFESVLLGKAKPMPQSAEVLTKLAGSRKIVFLTHRPDFFAAKSKDWLTQHHYPPAPLLLSTAGGFLKGSREFKTGALADLKKHFSRLEIGIGDKISDAQSYLDNGMKAFVILHTDDKTPPEELRELADELDKLSPEANVVTNWSQIAKALFEGATFPRSARQKQLRDQAARAKEAQP